MTTPTGGIDVGGMVVDLGQLEADLVAGGVAVPYGLTIVGPSTPPVLPPVVPPDPTLPEGSLLFANDAEGNLTDLPPAADVIVENYTFVAPTRVDPVVARQHIRDAHGLDQLKAAILEALAS
jgi:hypothetical protein